MCILVVDDSAEMCKLFDLQFKHLRLEADFAVGGLEALVKLATTKYQLVFMDVEMPIMGGIEATQRLRALEQLSGSTGHTPVIGITAGDISRDECVLAGMDDLAQKPLLIEHINDICNRWASKLISLEISSA